jgi:hypothetical protein
LQARSQLEGALAGAQAELQALQQDIDALLFMAQNPEHAMSVALGSQQLQAILEAILQVGRGLALRRGWPCCAEACLGRRRLLGRRAAGWGGWVGWDGSTAEPRPPPARPPPQAASRNQTPGSSPEREGGPPGTRTRRATSTEDRIETTLTRVQQLRFAFPACLSPALRRLEERARPVARGGLC